MPRRATKQPTNVALKGPWTIEKFFNWASGPEGRYEFDGIRPVARTGGNARHRRVTTNVHASLRSRLRGTSDDSWTAAALTIEDTLSRPEIGIEIPVSEFYEDVEFIDTLAE